ncbi:MAG: hypothetical protein PHY31_10180, partial [Smithellaceae bacterium]|nr:hypothetical protein [Smithellaceae bacterium]
MQIQDVFSRYRDDLIQVEQTMEGNLCSEINIIPEIIQHLIGGGGKRFRPLILLASSELCGYGGDKRFPMAAVIE